MEQLNRVELRGIVGEIRINPVGNAKVANFSVLTQHTFKGKDGAQATVHEIVASRVEILKEDILSPETDNKK